MLLPRWDVIRPKIQQAFANPQLAKEDAHLSVQNGTTIAGTGSKLRDKLEADGFNVTDLRAALKQGKFPKTTITDFSGGTKPNTIKALADTLGLDPTSVENGDPAKAPLSTEDSKPDDIVVIAGDDRLK